MSGQRGRPIGKARTKNGPYHDRMDRVSIGPVTLAERVRWKELELWQFQAKQQENPHDPVWPPVVARVRDELETLIALRDGVPRRRH